MKRFTAGLMLAGLTILASSAFAQNSFIAPHVTYEDLRFRTHAAATVGNEGPNYGVDVLGGYVDSLIATGLGVAGATSPLDTTTSVNTMRWYNELKGNTVAVADSNRIWATIQFYDSGGLTSASSSTFDSLYIATQASFDGKNWFTLATFLNGTAGTITSRLDQTNAAGAFFGVLNDFGASGSFPSFTWAYKYRVPIAAKQDQQAIWRYPFLRWIINSHDAVNYSLRARVFYTSASSD